MGRMFDYYCRGFGFDCLELNSSFYHLPSAKSMESLARRSPEGFHFVAKLNQAFTHNLAQCTPDLVRQFSQGIAPLAEAGKLSGLLAQFPSGFLPSAEAKEWLLYLRDRLLPHPIFYEFRHRLWSHPNVFTFLSQENLGYCIVDLPSVIPLPTFVPTVTNGVGYLRLHGRNREWYQPSTSRYDYSYSDRELGSFLNRIERITPSPGQFFIFFNNCHAGAAVRSAKRFRELAAGQEALAG